MVPSKVVVDKDDETLVLVFDKALDVGDGVLEATFKTIGNVPSELTALSNVPVSEETIDGDFKTMSFEESPLMSTYLVAVVVAFPHFRATHPAGIKVHAYYPVGKSEKGKLALRISVKSIDLYTNRTENYRLSCFEFFKIFLDALHIAVPDFSGGTMENYGLITYREAELLQDDFHSAAENTQRPPFHASFRLLSHMKLGSNGLKHGIFGSDMGCSIFRVWKLGVQAGTLSYMSLEAFIVNEMDADENIMWLFHQANDLILDMYHLVASTNGKIDYLFLRRLSLATTTVCEEFSYDPDQSPESFVTALIMKTTPEAYTQFPWMGVREVSLGPRVSGFQRRRRVKKRLDWYISLDEEKNVKEPKRRPAREWWKEEYYCDKLIRCMSIIERRKGVGARARVVEVALIGGWMDLVGLWRARHNSHASISGDIPNSRAMAQQPRIPSSGLMTGSDVLIRAKEPQFRYTQTPSKVLHLRNLPWDCTEEELIKLGKPFGKVVNTKCNVGANRNQAFIKFSEQNQAIAMISKYASSSEPAQVRRKTVYLQYSNRQEIVNNKTSVDVAGNVLLVTIEGNDARSVSIDVLHLVSAAIEFVVGRDQQLQSFMGHEEEEKPKMLLY
uniref:Polypyrimidine tract-binding protein homolog 2 isoform X4 n=1 Tax=Tanacetum cinerariifolium TaxID=118510 RepID=A0A6L2J1N9_TANCI|nr:polypyrimidine tract-binding protein homolog 2 isoform X4 [Tanacetum cinerariifolium]